MFSDNNSSDAVNNCNDHSNNDTYSVTSSASYSGVNNDISTGKIISNCVVSDNTTDITDNGNNNGNSNSSNVNCKNDKNIVVDNASSSHGNNSNIFSNIACSTILVDNVPSNANDKIDKVNDNDK